MDNLAQRLKAYIDMYFVNILYIARTDSNLQTQGLYSGTEKLTLKRAQSPWMRYE